MSPVTSQTIPPSVPPPIATGLGGAGHGDHVTAYLSTDSIDRPIAFTREEISLSKSGLQIGEEQADGYVVGHLLLLSGEGTLSINTVLQFVVKGREKVVLEGSAREDISLDGEDVLVIVTQLGEVFALDRSTTHPFEVDIDALPVATISRGKTLSGLQQDLSSTSAGFGSSIATSAYPEFGLIRRLFTVEEVLNDWKRQGSNMIMEPQQLVELAALSHSIARAEKTVEGAELSALQTLRFAISAILKNEEALRRFANDRENPLADAMSMRIRASIHDFVTVIADALPGINHLLDNPSQ